MRSLAGSSRKGATSFATPSPRLIPEGEKPATFAGLALAPIEGSTEGVLMHDNESQPVLSLPAGFFAVNRGGRPKNEARDAAVFLAHIHRVEAEGGKSVRGAVAKAEAWIVAQWEVRGITERAHVRSAIARAKKNGLRRCFLIHDSKTDLWSAVESVQPGGVPEDWCRSWHWKPGMLRAAEGRVKNARWRTVEEVLDVSPIARAIRSIR